MKRFLQGVVVLTVLLGLSAVALAAGDCPVCTNTTSDNHLVKSGSQLTRGAANTGLCWTELVNQPVKEARAGGNVLVGVGKGIGHTCLRAVKGASEIITAPLPKAKDGSQIASDCPMCMWGA